MAGEARYLDPAIVARLGTIDLKARTIVEGFLTGLHRSPYKGFSVEFAEYRQYLPGDDLATLDWKVYARSDRHFVKKYEEETNLTCHLLLDVSGSMGYGSGASHQAAVRLVPRRRARLPDEPAARRVRPDRLRRPHCVAAAGQRPRRTPARGAAGARAAASWARAPTSPSRCTTWPPRSASAAWSCWSRTCSTIPQQVLDGLKHFRYRGTDVVVFHVLDPYELKFPFEQAARFRDMETARRSDGGAGRGPPGLRRAHAGDGSRTTSASWGWPGIDYCLLDTSQPLELGLMAYLMTRRRVL